MIVIVALLIGGLSGTFSSSSPIEPTYAGKRLSDWVTVRWDRNPEVKKQAEDAISQIGTNALPFLLAELEVHDKGLKLKLVHWAEVLHFDKFRDLNADYIRRNRAANAMAALGSLATPAMPELVRRLSSKLDVNFEYAFCLGHIGTNALVPLTTALTNVSNNVRQKAAYGLGWMRTNGQPAIPNLLISLQDSDPRVRGYSARSLGMIRCKPDVVIPALIASLSDTNSSARSDAALALGDFGPAATAAIPDLIKVMSDPDSDVTNNAAHSLYWIDKAAAASIGFR